MACRSGCPTQDCGSYAACLKGTSFHTLLGDSHEANRSGEKELSAYAAARKQGIQPSTTKQRDIDAAVRVSEVAGRAFDSSTGSFK